VLSTGYQPYQQSLTRKSPTTPAMASSATTPVNLLMPAVTDAQHGNVPAIQMPSEESVLNRRNSRSPHRDQLEIPIRSSRPPSASRSSPNASPRSNAENDQIKNLEKQIAELKSAAVQKAARGEARELHLRQSAARVIQGAQTATTEMMEAQQQEASAAQSASSAHVLEVEVQAAANAVRLRAQENEQKAYQTAVEIEDQKMHVIETMTNAENAHMIKSNALQIQELNLKAEAERQQGAARELALLQTKLAEERNQLQAMHGNVQASELEAARQKQQVDAQHGNVHRERQEAQSELRRQLEADRARIYRAVPERQERSSSSRAAAAAKIAEMQAELDRVHGNVLSEKLQRGKNPERFEFEKQQGDKATSSKDVVLAWERAPTEENLKLHHL